MSKEPKTEVQPDGVQATMRGTGDARMAAKIGPEAATIQESSEPATSMPDEGGARRLSKHSTLWGIALLVAIPCLFFFGVGFAYRLARPGDDFWGFSANIAGMVSLIALLGLQFEQGREWLKTTSRRWAAMAWLMVAVAAVVFFLGPGPLSYRLDVVGVEALDRGDLASALGRFQVATGLDPRNAKAHFDLGDAYEATGNFDQAINEYRRALELDDSLAPVYNNLGRLYLRAHNDPDSAIGVLLAGLAHTDELLVRAVLRKNLGWAYLEKGLSITALEELQAADDELRALRNVTFYQAEVDRLKALAYEARGEQSQAQGSWTDCLSHAQGFVTSDCQQTADQAGADCINAQIWAAEARERTAALKGGS